jgi:hypothetical protein
MYGVKNCGRKYKYYYAVNNNNDNMNNFGCIMESKNLVENMNIIMQSIIIIIIIYINLAALWSQKMW